MARNPNNSKLNFNVILIRYRGLSFLGNRDAPETGEKTRPPALEKSIVRHMGLEAFPRSRSVISRAQQWLGKVPLKEARRDLHFKRYFHRFESYQSLSRTFIEALARSPGPGHIPVEFHFSGAKVARPESEF